MRFPFGITVTFQRAVEVSDDRYHNGEVAGWVDTVTLDGLGFAPAKPAMLQAMGRDGEATPPMLLGAPGDADIRNNDRCVIGGELWEVDGTPQVFDHFMTGWRPGSAIQLKRVDG